MKKTFSLLLAVMMLSALLFSCKEDAPEPITQMPHSSSTEESSQEPTEQTTEASSTEESTEETEPPTEVEIPLVDPVKVLYCSYTEKPYFAMLGTCNEGATVIATIGEESYSSESYMGWFSLRLPCEGRKVKVTLTQTTNGKTFDESFEYTAKPTTPEAGRWPVVTGGNFQFFLQKMLPDHQRENLYDEETCAKLEERIKGRLETVHAYNPDAEIIYLIVPSSMTVYPELVPEEYTQGSGKSRLDQVSEVIERAGATVIDLQAIFEEHKEDEMPLYCKLDSHWSDYGAYIAYQALFEHISGKFPEAAPRSAEEFNWNPDYYWSGDMSYYMGMSQSKVKEYSYYRTFGFDAPRSIVNIPRYRSKNQLFYSDNVTWEQRIKTDREELPSCLVIRDSYSTQLYDILAERMDYTHYMGMWSYTWDNATVKAEQPDYVIYVVAEWNIDSLLK